MMNAQSRAALLARALAALEDEEPRPPLYLVMCDPETGDSGDGARALPEDSAATVRNHLRILRESEAGRHEPTGPR